MAENETPKRTKSWPVLIYIIAGSGFLSLAASATAAKGNMVDGLIPALVGIGCALMALVFALYDIREP